MRRSLLLLLLALPTLAAERPTTSPPGVAHFPHLTVDLNHHELRIDCQSLNPQMPLEFFCVLAGTSEHESVLRTSARPSHIHTALLMLGAKPGSPARYDEAQKKWLPPTGSALDLSLEVRRDNKPTRDPAHTWVRDVKTKKPLETPLPFVFAGSRLMPDGAYAADSTGYVASLVNFDFTLIDVPRLASNSNETLEYEFNPDKVPKTGTDVTLIVRLATTPSTTPAQTK